MISSSSFIELQFLIYHIKMTGIVTTGPNEPTFEKGLGFVIGNLITK